MFKLNLKMEKPKLNTKSYEDRFRILKYTEDHLGMKKTDNSSTFEISAKTLSDVVKSKDKILKAVQDPASVVVKKVDKDLLTWFCQKIFCSQMCIFMEIHCSQKLMNL